MNAWDIVSVILISIGCFFFLGGGIGMLRFPDVFSRLHASTKADNLGLGFVIFGVLLQFDSMLAGTKLILVWLLVLMSSSTTCHLIAKTALRQGIEPWKRTVPESQKMSETQVRNDE
ncbi:Na(+)/H(+) antiporter subunit G [Rubripirellula obstinata]|uniref:Na(+)/H(+) antiporter subunit G n=1 Tax=Rubripirellula obstinata TaxID=406547 RepID=A0A5B1CN76_9BACT|nr:monovalent cation/H(+) antiporter subunit G [Rubripirellula obstinata]KAA1262006.1 Na(+)/H(+) antiporter subunit G [Rubripirellula obstinata]